MGSYKEYHYLNVWVTIRFLTILSINFLDFYSFSNVLDFVVLDSFLFSQYLRLFFNITTSTSLNRHYSKATPFSIPAWNFLSFFFGKWDQN